TQLSNARPSPRSQRAGAAQPASGLSPSKHFGSPSKHHHLLLSSHAQCTRLSSNVSLQSRGARGQCSLNGTSAVPHGGGGATGGIAGQSIPSSTTVGASFDATASVLEGASLGATASVLEGASLDATASVPEGASLVTAPSAPFPPASGVGESEPPSSASSPVA